MRKENFKIFVSLLMVCLVLLGALLTGCDTLPSGSNHGSTTLQIRNEYFYFVASEFIPSGTTITQDNFSSIFSQRCTYESRDVVNALSGSYDLIGCRVVRNIHQGETILKTDVEKIEDEPKVDSYELHLLIYDDRIEYTVNKNYYEFYGITDEDLEKEEQACNFAGKDFKISVGNITYGSYGYANTWKTLSKDDLSKSVGGEIASERNNRQDLLYRLASNSGLQLEISPLVYGNRQKNFVQFVLSNMYSWGASCNKNESAHRNMDGSTVYLIYDFEDCRTKPE